MSSNRDRTCGFNQFYPSLDYPKILFGVYQSYLPLFTHCIYLDVNCELDCADIINAVIIAVKILNGSIQWELASVCDSECSCLSRLRTELTDSRVCFRRNNKLMLIGIVYSLNCSIRSHYTNSKFLDESFSNNNQTYTYEWYLLNLYNRTLDSPHELRY